MEYSRLGSTGLVVSRLCLGAMSLGDPERGADSWTLGEAESRSLVRQALDAGITFFDTANVYSDGSSEEILGRALRDFTRRGEVVIATKVFGRMGPGPGGAGLSRKAVIAQLDASLTRLGTDYIDLYQIHRWDGATPVEETVEVLHDVVKAGKVRYVGASSMYAWQFAKALWTADLHGWTRFVSMQPHYNLLYREEEREMLPLCADRGVGVLPWSPLARGRLAREWNTRTARTRDDAFGDSLYARTQQADCAVTERVREVAGEHGVPPAQVALAWLLRNPVITAPVVGATRPEHLTEALGAVGLTLTDEAVQRLAERYVPHPVIGID
jgi:aryl-alcohol dehydrogenase-like predicted oxidoreductase